MLTVSVRRLVATRTDYEPFTDLFWRIRLIEPSLITARS